MSTRDYWVLHLMGEGRAKRTNPSDDDISITNMDDPALTDKATRPPHTDAQDTAISNPSSAWKYSGHVDRPRGT